MCTICTRIKKNLHLDSFATSAALKEIADAIKGGSPANHFDELVGSILGLEETERDTEIEQLWVKNYDSRSS